LGPMQDDLVAELNTALLDNLAEGVCLLTPGGDVIYMNLAAQEMLQLAGAGGAYRRHPRRAGRPEPVDGAAADAAGDGGGDSTTGGRLTLASHGQTIGGTDVVQVTLRYERRRTSPAARHGRPGERADAHQPRAERYAPARRSARRRARRSAAEHRCDQRADCRLRRKRHAGAPALQRGDTIAVPQVDKQAISRGHAVAVTGLRGRRRAGGIDAALVAPIMYEADVAGLVRLFSTTPAAFDRGMETFVSALANHAAIAIGNARRFDELQERNVLLRQRTQQLERFVESGRVFTGDRPLDDVYEDLVYAIQESVGYHAVLLSLAERDGETYYLRHIAGAGLPLRRLRSLRRERHLWAAVEQVAQPEFGLGGAFLVPAAAAAKIAPGLALPLTSELLPTPLRMLRRTRRHGGVRTSSSFRCATSRASRWG
jgi:GAF domain-containing protein